MLSIHDLSLDEGVYTFVDAKTGEPTHIAATTLMATLKRIRATPILCAIGEGLIDALKRGDLGVEEDHALALPESALGTPLLVCQWGNEHIIADGAHRLWRRWQRGDRDFNAYYLPEELWRPWVIHDMPGDGQFWDFFNRNVKVR
jgi:hypothetical protein